MYPTGKSAESSANGVWWALGYAHMKHSHFSVPLSAPECKMLTFPSSALPLPACPPWVTLKAAQRNAAQRPAQRVPATAHAKDSRADSRGLKWSPLHGIICSVPTSDYYLPDSSQSAVYFTKKFQGNILKQIKCMKKTKRFHEFSQQIPFEKNVTKW